MLDQLSLDMLRHALNNTEADDDEHIKVMLTLEPHSCEAGDDLLIDGKLFYPLSERSQTCKPFYLYLVKVADLKGVLLKHPHPFFRLSMWGSLRSSTGVCEAELHKATKAVQEDYLEEEGEDIDWREAKSMLLGMVKDEVDTLKGHLTLLREDE